ncbi:MAG: hypothetical protein AAGF45_00530 [Pseudomonadota bacterium]
MDIERTTLLVVLSLTTLSIALAIGLYQRHRASLAKKEGEHSALMDDPRFTDDTNERSCPAQHR